MKIGDHEVEVHGERVVSASFTRSPGERVHHTTPNVLVIDRPGHKGFGGQGRQNYIASMFWVYEIVDVETEGLPPGHFRYVIRGLAAFEKRR